MGRTPGLGEDRRDGKSKRKSLYDKRRGSLEESLGKIIERGDSPHTINYKASEGRRGEGGAGIKGVIGYRD